MLKLSRTSQIQLGNIVLSAEILRSEPAAEQVARSVEQLRMARDEISAEQACTADLRLDLAEAKQGAAVEAAKLDARNEAEVPHTLFGF